VHGIDRQGKYWIPVFNVLENSCNITLAHPKYVKAIRGKKTDQREKMKAIKGHRRDLESRKEELESTILSLAMVQ
jgi:hypothetical protein